MQPQQTELWTAELQTPPICQNLTNELRRQLVDQLVRLILKQIQAEPTQESRGTNNNNLLQS
jgi:hypothetical protein